MTDICKIGPVSIEHANLFENNTFNFGYGATSTVASGTTIFGKGDFTESYSFNIICSPDEGLQLKGLLEQGEIIWLDTSDLTDNDYLQHKGWVILTNVELVLESPVLLQATIQYIKISDHEHEYLDMSYTRGIYDGVNIDPSYDILNSPSYMLNEDGTDATTSWSTIKEYPTSAGTTWGTTGSVLQLATKSGVTNQNAYGWVYVDTKKFSAPYTFEGEIITSGAAASGKYAQVGFGFSPSVYGNNDKTFPVRGKKEFLECKVVRSSSSRKIRVNVTLATGKTVSIVPEIDVGTTGNVKYKLDFYYNGYVRISTNVNGAGYVQRYYGPSNLPSYKNGLYLTLTNMYNDTVASYAAQFDNIQIYRQNSTVFPNIVMLPAGATPLDTVDGTRVGSEGTSSYIVDPSDNIPFVMDSNTNLYKNSVKLLSTNNETSTSRQVFGNDIKLTPTTTTLQNGFTRLTFDADEVIVSGYYSGSWTEINRFDIGVSIDLVRPLRVTPNIVVLQVNASKWTMIRGSPIVRVEHPYTELAYVRKNTHYHDGSTTGSPFAAGATVTMQDDNVGYYATVYDSPGAVRLLIVKPEQCDILSDSLPEADLTGIGWVDNSATGYETAEKLAQQFYKQTRTAISLKQII